MVELVLAEVFRLANEYRDLENLAPVHSGWCDYTHRNLAVLEDCNCGALRAHDELLAEQAHFLVEAICNIDQQKEVRADLEKWLGVTNPTHVPAIGKTV